MLDDPKHIPTEEPEQDSGPVPLPLRVKDIPLPLTLPVSDLSGLKAPGQDPAPKVEVSKDSTPEPTQKESLLKRVIRIFSDPDARKVTLKEATEILKDYRAKTHWFKFGLWSVAAGIPSSVVTFLFVKNSGHLAGTPLELAIDASVKGFPWFMGAYLALSSVREHLVLSDKNVQAGKLFGLRRTMHHIGAVLPKEVLEVFLKVGIFTAGASALAVSGEAIWAASAFLASFAGHFAMKLFDKLPDLFYKGAEKVPKGVKRVIPKKKKK